MGLVTVYHVVDCPRHEQAALKMPTGRVFCFACGQEVGEFAGERYTSKPPADLLAEARDAWNQSAVLRSFVAGVQPGTTPLETRTAS